MSSAIAASSKRAAISAYGLEIEEIAEQCAESDITVIVGYCERAADRVFNAASVIGLDRVIGKHRKQRRGQCLAVESNGACSSGRHGSSPYISCQIRFYAFGRLSDIALA